MTDGQLAFLVAEARGCKPVLDAAIVFCPCGGMPHGLRPVTGPPRLHKFPRDISIGFLLSKGKRDPDRDEDGITVCRFVVSDKGQIKMKIRSDHRFSGYSFSVLMRGAAKEMDDHYEGEARRHSKTLNRFERDVDDLMGGADGVGQPGS